MRGKLVSIMVLFWLAVSGINLAHAQERSFNQDRLESLKKTRTYDYDRTIERSQSWLGKVLEKIAEFFESTLGSIVGYGILIAAVVIIVYLLLKSAPGGFFKKSDSIVNAVVLDETEDIQEIDLKGLLAQALKEENYRFAIRFLYLIILKDLDKQGILKWSKDKTNRDYLYEIEDDVFRNKLSELTRLFEYAWYGEIDILKQHFEQVKPSFDGFSEDIKNK